MEADTEDSQDLGDTLAPSNEAFYGTAMLPHSGGAESSTAAHEWLTEKVAKPNMSTIDPEAVEGPSADILGALRLSDGEEPMSPPRKGNATGKFLMLSPVLVMEAGCWSPLAAATPLKKAKNN